VNLALDLREGAVFDGQFRVVRPLAQGGMGAVYVVEQLATARPRALKLMHPSLVHDAKSRERFEREAQVAGRIASDHVVEVIAAGVEAQTGTPWLCMELLEGEDLAARMARGRPPPGDALEIVKQLGHALAAAHRAGIVHRDLKPENLFLAAPRREGVPFTLKVLDFGVAALVQDATGASQSTQGVGSPLWMAPEQADAGRVAAATDVWALGLLVYHLLTGSVFWNAARTRSALTGLLVEILVEPLPAASARAREHGLEGLLPRGFDTWFERCVVRDPATRFAEAGPAIAELVTLLTGNTPSRAPDTRPQALDATLLAPATPPLGGITRDPPAPAEPLPPPSPRPPGVSPAAAARPPTTGLVAAALLAAASVLAAGVGLLVHQLDQPPAPPAPGAPDAGGITEETDAGPPVDASVDRVPPAVLELLRRGVEARLQGDDDAALAAFREAHALAPELGRTAAQLGLAHQALGAWRQAEPLLTRALASDDPWVAEHREALEGSLAVVREHLAAPEAAPRAHRPPAASPVARALRAWLDRCVRDNLAGEPSARWTFTLRLGPSGAENVAIVGPHAGEPSGPYPTFRRCVVQNLRGFDPGGDPGPFTLSLP
jgi:serine/threonine protein kinase